MLTLGGFSLNAAFGGSGGPNSNTGGSGLDTSTTTQHLVVTTEPWHLQAPVSRAAVVPDRSALLILGGLATGDTSTGAIWKLDPATGRVSGIGQLATPVHDTAGAMLGGTAYVFGGGSYSTVTAVQALTPNSTRAVSVSALPVGRSDHSAVTIGTRAYILGGFDGTALVPEILATANGMAFRTVGHLAQPVRYGAVAALGGSIYVVGGELGTSEGALSGGQTNDIQRFDPATGKTMVVGHLPVTLGHAAAVALDGQLYVLGGRTGASLSSRIWRVDPTNGAVSTVGTMASPRSDAGVAVIGDRAYLVGGESTGPSAPLATVLEVRLATSHTTTPGGSNLAAAPPPGDQHNIYAADGPDMLSPVVRNMPYRIYVPESAGSDVDVIDPHTYKVVARYETGLDPQHVIPAWNLKTIYAANDLGNSLTPISPYTGRRKGPNIAVDDPYNMYFTPNGKYAIVVEEANQVLAFRNPKTFKLTKALRVDCPGVDHGDFSADGSFAIFSCEFSAQMVKVNLKTLTVTGYLPIPGSAPQDVKLDPTGTIFYSADQNRGGVYLISAARFKVVGFIPTGTDAHGLYVSRNARYLYVTNRGAGSISVINLATRKVQMTWAIPGGGSPDMGNLSPDGKVLWLSGRYDACVYAISTVNGKLLAEIPVPNKPHGLLVWPQPGRYSIGHTGIMR